MDQNVSKTEGCLCEVPGKMRGEIRTDIFEAISSVDQDRTGRGPNEIRGHMIGDLLVVRLVVRLGGSLTEAERQLVRSVLVENTDEKIQLSADAHLPLHPRQECHA
jgi:uncharacterized protein YbcI